MWLSDTQTHMPLSDDTLPCTHIACCRRTWLVIVTSRLVALIVMLLLLLLMVVMVVMVMQVKSTVAVCQ